MTSSPLLSEAHLQRLWLFQRFDRLPFVVEDGRRLEVLFPGFPGVEGGPDFRGAVLRLGGEVVRGDVEIHLTFSGWHRHGHASDAAYEGVVLQVVLDRGEGILPGAVLILRPYLPCSEADLLRGGGFLIRSSMPLPCPGEILEAAGVLRWRRRRERFERESERVGSAEALYRRFLAALGYRKNTAAFRELARMVPEREIAGRPYGGILQRLTSAARQGCGWRRQGVRPASRPECRIRGAAGVLSRGSVATLFRGLLPSPFRISDRAGAVLAVAPAVRALEEWGGFGPERARTILLHGLLPGLAGEEALELLRRHPALAGNRRENETAKWKGWDRPGNVLQQIGVLEIRDVFEGWKAIPGAEI